MASTRKEGANVERVTVKGHDVWHVRDSKTGRFQQVTTKVRSRNSMDKATVKYDRALKRLADR